MNVINLNLFYKLASGTTQEPDLNYLEEQNLELTEPHVKEVPKWPANNTNNTKVTFCYEWNELFFAEKNSDNFNINHLFHFFIRLVTILIISLFKGYL